MADAPRILIVTSRYYANIMTELEASVAEGLEKVGATYEFLEVPGAFEIPAAISMAASTGEWDGFVALGCVIRGETSHYDLVAGESCRGLMELGIRRGACIGNGILTVENEAQALARANPRGQDKGGGAAAAALSLLTWRRRLGARAT